MTGVTCGDSDKGVLFVCCQCHFGPFLATLYTHCVGCEHYRCSSCPWYPDPVILRSNRRRRERERKEKEKTIKATTPGEGLEAPCHQQKNIEEATKSTQYVSVRSDVHAAYNQEKPLSTAVVASQAFGAHDTRSLKDAPTSHVLSTSSSGGQQDWVHDKKDKSNRAVPEVSVPVQSIPVDSTTSEANSSTDQEDSGVSTPLSSLNLETQDDHLDLSEDNGSAILEAAPRTLKEILIGCLLHIVCKSLHRYLRTTSMLDGENRSNDPTAPASQQRDINSGMPTSRSKINKRKERDGDEHSGDERDGGRRERKKGHQPDRRNVSGLRGRLFACHFCKRRPLIYQGRRWKNCGPGWLEVHRVKQHILDHHKLRPRCERCGDEFDTYAHVAQHLQNETECPRRRLITNEGVSLDMQGRIKDRTGLCKMTAEEKWIHWYKILFPNDDFESMPSPYYEPNAPTMSAYDDFLRHDFLSELQAALEIGMPEQIRETMPQLMPQLRAFVISTVRTVHNRFAENQNLTVRATVTPDAAREQTESYFPEQMPIERVVTPAMGTIPQTMGVAEMDDVWQSSIHDTFAQQLTEDNFMADFDIASWAEDFGEFFDSVHQGELM